MNRKWPVMTAGCVAASFVLLGASAAADTVSMLPVADAFVASAQPSNNYGGGGALSVAAPGLAQGEFQSLLRFDTAAAAAGFDATFGAGQWTIQSVTLRLTAMSPNNPLFNASAAGQFAASWMSNDSWVEGTGTPNAPTTNGVTFATLPSFLSGTDEPLGTFAFAGGTSGNATYSFGLPAAVTSDIRSGALVSLRLLAADAALSYLFASRSNSTVDARPQLAITAVPEPASAVVMLLGSAIMLRRRGISGRADRTEIR